MTEDTPGREARRVRLYSLHGLVEGNLHVGARLRTLDDLNVVAKRFVQLHPPTHATNAAWSLDGGPVAVNKKAILFAQELASPPQRSGMPFGGFTRSAVRLRIGDYEVEGFVHVPPGGEPMRRFDQDNHAFISLTTVLVVGPEGDRATPFLAVNRDFITAAQVVGPEPEPDALPPSNIDVQA
jgi:hypothetical protein